LAVDAEVSLFQMGIADYFFRAESKMRQGGKASVPPAWASSSEKKVWQKGKRYAAGQVG